MFGCIIHFCRIKQNEGKLYDFIIFNARWNISLTHAKEIVQQSECRVELKFQKNIYEFFLSLRIRRKIGLSLTRAKKPSWISSL